MKMFKTAVLLCSTVALIGCGVNPNTQQGEFAISIQWPENDEADFQIQAIPTQTSTLEVEIKDENTNEVIKKEIKRQGQSQERMLMKLSAGKKAIQVKAFDSNQKLLAQDSTRVLIEAGKKSTAILDLQAVEAKEDVSVSTEVISNQTTSEVDKKAEADRGSQVKDVKNAKKAVLKKAVGNARDKVADKLADLTPRQKINLKTKLNQLTKKLGLPAANHSGGGNSGFRIPRGGAAPVIHSLSANPGVVSGVLYPTEIKVEVTDDNMLLPTDFHWSCQGGVNNDCGTFTNNKGRKVIWRAPAKGGVYVIKVKVSDGVNVVAKHMTILVKEGTANAQFQGGIN